MRAKLINEKFEENSVPISDLKIGGIVLQPEFEERRKKLDKDIEKTKERSIIRWESYLRKLFIGKTIQAEMQLLPTFSTNLEKQIRKSEFGIFTAKVIDIVAQDINYEYNNYVLLVSEDHIVYKFILSKKIHIVK